MRAPLVRLLLGAVMIVFLSGLLAAAGRSAVEFDVAGAASLSNVSMSVTFDAPPDPTAATTLSNYDVPGLTLSGTPTLSGRTVTITTSAQSAQGYTVTVSGVTRVTDGASLSVDSADFTGKTGFNVSSAASVNQTTISVTFDAPPNQTEATTLANYSVPGLTLSGVPVLSGSTVTLTTSAQSAGTYTVTVSGVTSADGAALSVASANFGYGTIDVNTTSDVAANGSECSGVSGDCSLRQALDKAQPGDTVQLLGTPDNPAVYTLTLGATLSVTKNVTILGNGPDATVIDGQNNLGGTYGEQYRIMTVSSNKTVSISGVTFRHGVDANDENSCSACATLSMNGGGALFNNGGNVTLSDVAFTDDSGSPTPVGGGVSNGSGTLTMTDVSFTNDSAAQGGGLFVRGGTVTGTGLTFENNGGASFGGGAVYLYGGTTTLTNSTFVGNGWASSRGGGVENSAGTLILRNDTFSGNIRGAIETLQGGATTSVENTIIGAGFSDGTDYGCVSAGQSSDRDFVSTAAAITNDLGHNVDQDGHCGLSDTGDVSNVDPKLASIADNGGPTRTMAVIAGSPALDPATDADCPATDQRGTTRPQGGTCDIGAFEAIKIGDPTATTDAAQNVESRQADLGATINLDGEAGGVHFLWGTAQDALVNTTDIAGAGIVSSDTAESQTLSGLSPGTTYYFEAVADNASASVPAGNVLSFTTPAEAPSVYGVSSDSVDDTSATIHFTIDPEGADTTYVIDYGPTDSYGSEIGPFDIGSQTGPQTLQKTLHNLTPTSTYHFAVVASNAVQADVGSGDGTFATGVQIKGTAGSQVTLTDSGDTWMCPAAPTIDWGDGSTSSDGQVQCTDDGEDGSFYTVTAHHTYAVDGHYAVVVTYSDVGLTADQWAQIGLPILTVHKAGSGTGTVSSTPSGISCGSTCAKSFAVGTDVTLTAAPTNGSTFKGWSGGGCTGTGTCHVTLNAGTTITATFTLLRSLTVAKAGAGSGVVTSSPVGIYCGSACTHNFAAGTAVTLTARPATGSAFAGWTGACTGTSTLCHVTMSAARSVTATFAVRKETLTVGKAGTGAGTVSSSPLGVACGATCSHAFVYGTAVTLTARASTGSRFAGWSGACTGTSTCRVTMIAARRVAATFVKLYCVVPNVRGKTLAGAKTAIANAHCTVGTVSQARSTKVAKGRVISETPAPGKQLAFGAKVNLVVSSGAGTASRQAGLRRSTRSRGGSAEHARRPSRPRPSARRAFRT